MVGRTRKKAEETPVQKGLKAAQAAHKAAKERLEKQNNDVNKSAADKAKQAYKTAQIAANRERFTNLGGARFGKVIDFIKLLQNCSDRRSYEFNAADVEKAFKAVQDEIDTTKTIFLNALKVTTAEKKEGAGKTVFKF